MGNAVVGLIAEVFISCISWLVPAASFIYHRPPHGYSSAMKPKRVFTLKFALLVVAIVAIVSAPFVIWGDAYVLPLLQSHVDRTGLLIIIAIVLLAADSVAPVPATLVIMFLAAHSGRLAGIVGGTLGMAAGVLTAAWFGRTAVGRLAPKFFPDTELARLRSGLQRNLAVTLACWHLLPVPLVPSPLGGEDARP